ncbi:MAG: hypothetical protein U1E70_17925 [Acetobacteraceae bacterium]|nr:hypothetical protein [Pseudomonadota bacterium]
MVGITLSPEQVRGAPPEVRRWLEQQIAEALGFQRPAAAAMQPPPKHLIACDVEPLRTILQAFQNVLPVVSVFFELAREPAMVSPQGLRVLHLDDMTRHCRLQSPAQIVACLDAINRALQGVLRDPEAVLTVIDSNEHVLVPDVTARSIHTLWEEVVRPHAAAPAPTTQAEPAAVNAGQPYQSPYAINVAPQPPGGLPRAG